MSVWAGAALLALGLGVLEARRTDRRHLALRIAAVSLALAALAALLAPPHLTSRRSRSDLVVLLTPGTDAATERVLADSFPGTTRTSWPDSVTDLGALRRRWPDLGGVVVAGWGLRGSEWRGHESLPVRFVPAELPAGFTHLYWTRSVRLGDPVTIEGRLNRAFRNQVIRLVGPDGLVDSTMILADTLSRFAFTVATRAVGRARFVLAAAGVPAETLGVAIEPRRPPAVLILAAAPSFEATFLRRWLASQGAAVAGRTRLSRERDLVERVNFPAVALRPLTPALLDRFDLVVADGATLAALSAAERQAVDAAIRQDGLGLLMMPDSTAIRDTGFFPFRLVPTGGEEDRTVRPSWAGQAGTAMTPVPALPSEVGATPGLEPVMRDPVGRILAGAVRHGRGRIGTSVVLAPSRWLLEAEPTSFAGYWAALIGALARARGDHWAQASEEPVVVGEPVDLVLVSRDTVPAVTITTPSGSVDTLGLAQDLAAPDRWWGRFWPREHGWHAATNGAGDPYHFDVGVPAVTAREAAARQAATVRQAELSPDPSVVKDDRSRRPLGPLLPFLVLVATLGVLWGEGRMGRGFGFRVSGFGE